MSTFVEMKRFAFFLVIFAMAVTSLSGQELSGAPYFCNQSNTALEYVRTTAEGDIKWYHTMRIGDAVTNGGRTDIDYTSHILNHKHKPYYGKEPAQLAAVVTADAVVLNVAESVAAIFRTILPGSAKIISTGGESSLPSNMSPGDTLPDVLASVKAFGLTMKITVTERKVLREETITTPAGKFNCMVIRERKVEKGMGRNRHTIADTWYAKGIGMVRHDTYDTDLKLLTSEVLTAIRR